MRALLPLLLSAWWADLDRPHVFLDQNTGLSQRFDDWFFPELSSRYYLPSILNSPSSLDFFNRNWENLLRPKDTGSSIITADKDTFKLILDVQNFKPDEIKVKVVDRFVVVEAKHEEKDEDKKLSKMHFLKKYYVPDLVDIKQIKSTLSSDGVLMITAPIIKAPEVEKKETLIPIEQTGKPAIEEKKPEEKKPEEKDKKEKDVEEVTVESVPEK